MTEKKEVQLRKLIVDNLKKTARVDNTWAYVVKDLDKFIQDMLNFIQSL